MAVKSVHEPLVNTTIGNRFVLRELIGTGGMGKVYRADEEGVERTVAVKIMHAHLLEDATALARFTNEARATSSLNHPHTVSILDFGQTQTGMLYIVMEYLRGRALDAVLRESFPLPLGRVAFIMCQALEAVEAAHQQNIVHRDLKPENIFLLDDGSHRDFVKVLDFGIAKMLDHEDRSVTTPGLVPGTPEYMSPEQARGEQLDGRSDVYALGVILYEMLTSTVPFKGPSAIATMMSHVQDPVEPPSARRPDLNIPAALDEIVKWALAKDLGERLGSVPKFREVLSAWARIADVWPAEFDSAASAPAVLLDYFSQADLTDMPAQVSSEQRAERIPEPPRPLTSSGGVPTVRSLDELIGRSAEINQLKVFLGENKPRALRVEGDLGMGKSRLVDELERLAASEGYDVWRIRPQPGWERTPLYAARHLAWRCLGLNDRSQEAPKLRRAALERGIDPADVPGLADLLNLSTPLSEIEPDRRRRERMTAFRHLVYATAREARILLIFEHLERQDGPSRDLIMALANAPRQGMAVVVTHAPDPSQLWPSDVQCLQLAPLDTAEAVIMARKMLGGPDADEEACARIARTARGVPLFIDQLTHAAAYDGLADPPDRLGDLVAGRVERLERADRYPLQWLAVLNEPISVDALAALSGSEFDHAQLSSLARRGFLREDGGRCVFSHHVVAMVVYSSIPAEVRREMHQTVAAWQRQLDASISTIAFHAYRADDGARAVEELTQSGTHRRICLDVNGAIANYTQALELVRREWGRGRVDADKLDRMAVALAMQLADVLRQIGDGQTAEGVLGEILSVAAADHRTRARLRLSLGQIDLDRGNPQRAVRHLQLAKTDAQAIPSNWIIGEVTRELARARALMGDNEQAVALLAEALDATLAAEISPGTTPEQPGSAWKTMLAAAITCGQVGLAEHALSHLQQALKQAEREGSLIGRLRVLTKLGDTLHGSERLAEADECYQQGLGIAQQVGDRTGKAEILIALGRLKRIQTDIDTARSYLEDASSLSRIIGWWDGIKLANRQMEAVQLAASGTRTPANTGTGY